MLTASVSEETGASAPYLNTPDGLGMPLFDRRSNVVYFSDASPGAPLALFHTKERACLKPMDATA